MAVSYLELANHIKALLENVNGIGRVQTVPSQHMEMEDLENAITTGVGDSKKINFWFIRRVAIRNLRRTGLEMLGTERREHEFVVTGYYGYEGEDSEYEFQDLLDDIATYWAGKITKSSASATALNIEYSTPPEFINIGHTQIGQGYWVCVCNIMVRFQEPMRSVTVM